MLRRFGTLLIQFAVAVAGNLLAGWIIADQWSNLFTPLRLSATFVISVLGLLVLAWLESGRDWSGWYKPVRGLKLGRHTGDVEPHPRSKPKVFISYSHADHAFVDRLVRDLQRSNVDVWIDKWDIKVGESIRQRISEGIQRSDHLVAVLSRNSVNSKWVLEELNEAAIRNIEQDKGAFVLPILIEACQVPSQLRHRKYADFRQNYDRALQELIEAIRPALESIPGEADIAAQSSSTSLRILLFVPLLVLLLLIATAIRGCWPTTGGTGKPTPTATMSPRATNTRSIAVRTLEPCIVLVSPPSQSVKVGEAFAVEIKVDSVTNLYGVDVRLTFDASRLEVQDANSSLGGIQIEQGTFLNPAQGFMAQNIADNVTGQVQYAFVLLTPAPAPSGAGVLMRVNFVAKAQGDALITLNSVTLSDDQAMPIHATLRNGSVTVTQQTALVFVNPPEQVVVEGQTVIVEVAIDSVSNLTGVDLRLTFDAAMLEAQDANSSLDGIQIEQGDFLNPAQGFMAQNVANNDTGQVQYAFVLLDPAPPVSGSGVLARMVFVARAAGNALIKLDSVVLSDDQARPIAATLFDGSVHIMQAKVMIRTPYQPVFAGDTVTAEVRVEDVLDLSGFVLHLTFDPEKLEVQDAKPSMPGVQIQEGEFLDPEQGSASSLVYNQAGRLQYEFSLFGAAAAASGSGIVARIPFKAKAEGEAVIALSSATLYNSAGQSFVGKLTDGSVTVLPAGLGSPIILASPPIHSVAKGQTVIVEITGKSIRNLYGLQLSLGFDASKLQAVDADAATGGIQVEPGDSVKLEYTESYYNWVDNTGGEVRYGFALRPPAAPLTASATLARIAFRAIATGNSPLVLQSVTIYDDEHRVIQPMLADGSVAVWPGDMPPTIVLVTPPHQSALVGQVVMVEVRVDSVRNLHAVGFLLGFDASRLEILDATHGLDGVQMEPGDFLSQQQSFPYINSCDNAGGEAQYGVFLTSSDAEVSGSGVLARIAFRAKTEGESAITLRGVRLFTRDWLPIPTTLLHGRITILRLD